MENYFETLKNDLIKLWQELSNLQKGLIVFLVFSAVAAVFFVVMKATETQWGVLYSDLAETDALAVVASLKKAGYPYKLSDDSRTVLVPLDTKEDLRLMIAENDIIQDSNPGFDLLNKMQFGATEFQNKLTRQKIFQDELTKTIENISGIKKARIQLAEPDRSVFSTRDETPSASVMLIIEPGVKLRNDQIKAIKNLVAYGIPRLTPEKVFVTDQNGMSVTDEATRNTSDIIDYKTEFERKTVLKVQKVLQKIVGMENVSVEVSAVINFDRTKTTIEQYLPSSAGEDAPLGIISSSTEETEAYDKAEEETKNYKKTNTSRDYKVSKEVKQVVYAPGKVERMTVAVALNKILTSSEREEIKNLVISASGADIQRGDMVTVTGIQFAATEVEATPILGQIGKISTVEFMIRQVGPLVVVLILGLTALLVLRSVLGRPIQGEEVRDSSAYLDSLEEGEGESLLEEPPPVPLIEASLDPELEKMRNELSSTISADPSTAARLLQSYIRE